MKDSIIKKIDEITDVIDNTPDYGILAMTGLGAANWVAPDSDKRKMDILYKELKGMLSDISYDKENPAIKPFLDDTVYLNYTWRKYNVVKKYLNALKEYIKSLA